MRESGEERGVRLTERLRLEPVTARAAEDLWLVHGDNRVWPSYGAARPSREQTRARAAAMEEAWRRHGVHKWLAYDRSTDELVGRGGLSRVPMDDDWGRLEGFLPAQPWVGAAHPDAHPFLAYADWVEIGWALRGGWWGWGYASEIGRAALGFAFDTLGVQAVVSCTARHNARSRAVMERLGMRHVGEIMVGSPAVDSGAALGGRPDTPFEVNAVLRGAWLRVRD